MIDQLPEPLEARGVIFDCVVRDATYFGVHHGTAESLGIDDFASCAFHEIRAREPHERRALDHQDHVGERGEIRAARNALPHHRRELRNPQVSAHDRVVVEDPRRAVLPREDAALVRQVHARRIHEVDDRDTTAHRDLLRAQDLGNRLRPPRSRLHGWIVGNHDAQPAVHRADPRDHARRRRLALVLVVRDQHPDLEEARAAVAQSFDSLPRGELPLLVHLGCARLTSALRDLALDRANRRAQLAEA